MLYHITSNHLKIIHMFTLTYTINTVLPIYIMLHAEDATLMLIDYVSQLGL